MRISLKDVLAFVAVALVLALSGASNGLAQSLDDGRPGPEGVPTRIDVAAYLLDVESINDLEQTFKVDFVLRLRWSDSRLSGKGPNLPLENVWHPNVTILNQRSADTLRAEVVAVNPEGQVEYTQRYQAKLYTRFDLRPFPHDEQQLPIILLAAGYSPAEVELVVGSVGAQPEFSIPGWAVEVAGAESGTMVATLISDEEEPIERPTLEIQLNARRQLSYYRWKVLVPLSLVVLLSWTVFWIPPTQLGVQLGVSSTSVLTTIAFLLSLQNLIPPVPYLTQLDRFVYTCLILICAAFVEAVATIRIAAVPERHDLATRIDLWCRVLFPIAYGSIVAATWLT